jgi:hypothetical protein
MMAISRNPADLLYLSLPDRPEGCLTVREYLVKLLGAFWNGEASFKYGMSGNSDWKYELYKPMINAGMLPGRDAYGVDGYVDGYGLSAVEAHVLESLILAAIRDLR